MGFKFEKLEVWQLALDYIDVIYEIAALLPSGEQYNLGSQVKRAATSVALNIAEGSTGQTDAEQARFLGLALRSVVETVACLHIVRRRSYLPDPAPLRAAYRCADQLAAKLQKFRNTIAPQQPWLRDDPVEYTIAENEEPDQ